MLSSVLYAVVLALQTLTQLSTPATYDGVIVYASCTESKALVGELVYTSPGMFVNSVSALSGDVTLRLTTGGLMTIKLPAGSEARLRGKPIPLSQVEVGRKAYVTINPGKPVLIVTN